MVQIIADTLSSIPVPKAKDLGIPFLPQIVIFGKEEFRDDTEMDAALFLKKLRSSNELPKTSAPPPELYTPIYREIIDKNDQAIVIAPSSELSGTVRGATVAAVDFPGTDIRILDTKTIAGGLGELVLIADQYAKQGMNMGTLMEKMQNLANRSHTYFLVDTLEYLHKGGRIGGAKMLFGSLLQMKPILHLVDGRTEPAESQRTKKRALERIVELVMVNCPKNSEAHLCISHSEADSDVELLKARFEKETGIKDIPVYGLPPAILTHAGPGAIAISYIRAE